MQEALKIGFVWSPSEGRERK